MGKEKTLSSFLLDNLFLLTEEKTVPFQVVNFSCHNAYEIYLLLEGERRVFIGEKAYQTYRGDAALIRPGERHKSDGNTPYKGICLQFTDHYLQQFFTPTFRKRFLKCFAHPIISLSAQELEEFLALFEKMQKMAENRCYYLPQVLLLFSQAADNKEEADRAIKSPDFHKIASFLEENYQNISGLETVATKFGISREHLCREFKKQHGMTVITYLNNVRIQQACRLLEKTDWKIEKISSQCGFPSAPYFYRVFRKVIHYSPMEYRRQRRRVEAP